ncbi:MAG: LAGLIDADG family homing endonuclease [Candidatus Vogelbacteria bacterium]|nr:LAGLIDADG family homing endonuclease [Candidatus Vogelbacteria bacterium]
MSDNVLSEAENQQGRLVETREPSETTRQSPLKAKMTRNEILAYLQGAMHDASLNKGTRIRFTQKNRGWLVILQELLAKIGSKSWIYQEGKQRNVYALETVTKELSFTFQASNIRGSKCMKAYIRGFFDAEGGIPHTRDRFYIQLVQKNWKKVEELKRMLEHLGIGSGKIHNPSKKIDPNYWRLFIASADHKKFATEINSLHPVKRKIFKERMMI